MTGQVSRAIFWASQADLPFEIVNTDAFLALRQAPGELWAVPGDEFIVELGQSQVVWQRAATIFGGIDAHNWRVVYVLREALLLQLFLGDGYNLLQRCVTRIDRPGLLCLEGSLRWVPPETQLEPQPLHTIVSSGLSQMVNLAKREEELITQSYG